MNDAIVDTSMHMLILAMNGDFIAKLIIRHIHIS